MCGGTPAHALLGILDAGLSPRVRGNLLQSRQPLNRPRSIPACAGEPTDGSGRCRHDKVYPRVCGGTGQMRRPAAVALGLSPRVRGNRVLPGEGNGPVRSIPACAGEPIRLTVWTYMWKVYPRVCGGTTSWTFCHHPEIGLSPRVRGNPAIIRHPVVALGSIPACAGEPLNDNIIAGAHKVYPRVCGGTSYASSCVTRGVLSPRVRGNQTGPASSPYRQRSIPACAGEPYPARLGLPLGKVYPRVCGGTLNVVLLGNSKQGLSPRVRGNLQDIPPSAICRRSIPACAGEPSSTSPAGYVLRVYPRVCGGTEQLRT